MTGLLVGEDLRREGVAGAELGQHDPGPHGGEEVDHAGPTTVVDVSGQDGPLTSSALGMGDRVEGGRLLVRTGRSIAHGSFPERWPWIDPDEIPRLLAGGLRLLGVDAPSVDSRDSKSLDVHRALFAGGAFVLENLDLTNVTAGRYYLSAFPVRFAGLDAAPVRAVLRSLNDA